MLGLGLENENLKYLRTFKTDLKEENMHSKYAKYLVNTLMCYAPEVNFFIHYQWEMMSPNFLCTSCSAHSKCSNNICRIFTHRFPQSAYPFWVKACYGNTPNWLEKLPGYYNRYLSESF